MQTRSCFVAVVLALGVFVACGGAADAPLVGAADAGEEASLDDGSRGTDDAGGSADSPTGPGHDAAHGDGGGSDASGDAGGSDATGGGDAKSDGSVFAACEAEVARRGNFGCTKLDPCAVADWTFKQAQGAAPPAAGGNVTPGTYHLVEKVQYGPGSAVLPAGEGRATLVVNNNLVVVSWVAYRTLAPGGQRNLVEMAGAYSEKTATAVDPPLLDWQISCPGPAFTRVYPYTSTASELDLYEQTKSTTLVSRYVL